MTTEMVPTGSFPTDDDMVERIADVIRAKGVVDAARSNLASFTAAVRKTQTTPRTRIHPSSSGTAPLVAALTGFSVTALSEHDRLQLAQDLIATVTSPGASPQADALANGKQSILDTLDVIDSIDVARILAPTSTATRSVAQKRRKAGDLIGLPVGTRPDYRYPAFQFDAQRNQIRPLVRYANQRLDVANDPYGAASWWLTPTDILDGRSPLDDLDAGDLTEIAIDNVLDAARRGM